MLNIYVSSGHHLGYKKWNFSGGEVGFKIEPRLYQARYAKIVAHLRSSHDVMELLMATDALKRQSAAEIDLVMPYVPYARQDRVCNSGEALSIKVFADLINAQGYRSVEIWDAHSDVTPALLDRCKNVEQWEFAGKAPVFSCTIVAPDAGAEKKAMKLATKYKQEFAQGLKIRDTSTGDITGSVIWEDFSLTKPLYIVDDICDGGRTFIELAKIIKKNPDWKQPIYLYVTHGIFSKGLDVLKPHIDHVYTANIWPDLYKGNEKYVTILNRN